MSAGRLDRLAVLAGLLRDRDLAGLREANQARRLSLDRIAALDRPSAPGASLPEHQARLLYDIWAEQRRADLVAVLARQETACDEARHQAARAVGRAAVIVRLQDRDY